MEDKPQYISPRTHNSPDLEPNQSKNMVSQQTVRQPSLIMLTIFTAIKTVESVSLP